jgi:hypothetical protein
MQVLKRRFYRTGKSNSQREALAQVLAVPSKHFRRAQNSSFVELFAQKNYILSRANQNFNKLIGENSYKLRKKGFVPVKIQSP